MYVCDRIALADLPLSIWFSSGELLRFCFCCVWHFLPFLFIHNVLGSEGLGDSLKMSISIYLNFLLHFRIPLSHLPHSSVLQFWNTPP